MLSSPKSRYLLAVSDLAKKEQKGPHTWASRLACAKELQKAHIELWISLKKTWFTYQRKEGRRLANYKMESTGPSPDINSQTIPSRVKPTQAETPSRQHRNAAYSRALTTVAPKVFRLFLIFPRSTRSWIFRCSPKNSENDCSLFPTNAYFNIWDAKEKCHIHCRNPKGSKSPKPNLRLRKKIVFPFNFEDCFHIPPWTSISYLILRSNINWAITNYNFFGFLHLPQKVGAFVEHKISRLTGTHHVYSLSNMTILTLTKCTDCWSNSNRLTGHILY